MHLFNVNRLAARLRANALSETEKFRYLLALAVLHSFNLGIQAVSPRPNSSNFIIVAAVTTALYLTGLYLCYKANERGDNQRFIERFVCLSVPVSIWVYLSYLLCFYGGFIVAQSLMGRTDANALWRSLGSLHLLIQSAMIGAQCAASLYFIGQIARPDADPLSAPLAAP